MATRDQRERRKIRDKKKAVEGMISSIKRESGINAISSPMILKVAQVAQDLDLDIVALVALEALKVNDRDLEIGRLQRANAALEKQIVAVRGDLRQAQEKIANMNVRYVRRGSKKARVQHPEKRGGR